MEYEEILQRMFSSLPMYQRVGAAAYKADLSNTWSLAELTDHPEKTFRSIHIAGTNGKGSTAHMLASIFMEAGYKVGLYTSPHLVDFRERIKDEREDDSQTKCSRFLHYLFSEVGRDSTLIFRDDSTDGF